MKSILVILAGGKATRLGLLGKLQPKTSLIAFDEPLLIRQINHGLHSPISEVMISVNEKNYTLIADLVSSYIPTTRKKVTVFKNTHHRFGSLHGLLYILRFLKTERIITSFGDIFFYTNPFQGISNIINSDRTYICGAKPFGNELLLGGVIDVAARNRVRALSASSIPITKTGFRWNGIALLNAFEHYVSLHTFLKNAPSDVPEEEYFTYYNTTQKSIFFAPSSDFVNVNTLADLYLTSTIRFSEISSREMRAALALEKVAMQIRESMTIEKLQRKKRF